MEPFVGDSSRPRGAVTVAPDHPPAGLSWRDGRLFRGGVPHRVLSGSLHYFRVPHELWQDRLLRLLDLGLNTVDTYTPWNFHQPYEEVSADFRGWRDVRAFLEAADNVGLDVIVRPGPYICAEWSNGGLPAWLTAREMSLRSSDPRFLAATDAWFSAVIPEFRDLQASAGGPVIAVQVENEFGSYGDDPAYVPAVAGLLRAHGITEMLYTADGPTELMLDAGTVPDLLSAITLGSRPRAARELHAARRPDEPFFCAEFWNGWFDHWGQPHHIRGAANAAQTVADVVAHEGSISLYMAHGGTNFGLWAGANHVDGELRATTTSYDSDAPIAEDGTLTEKFFAIRDALGATGPLRSAQPQFVSPFTVEMTSGASLLSALEALQLETFATGPTCTFEQLGADSGLLRLDATVQLPGKPVVLRLRDVGDRATVFVDGVELGTVQGSGSMTMSGSPGPVHLTLVIESLGRVNYGPGLGEWKGLRQAAVIERRMIQQWTASVVPLDRLDGDELFNLFSHNATQDAPVRGDSGVSMGTFHLDRVADAHLALPDWGKGFVWVNGFLLGRYWSIGPQQTLYTPRTALRQGRNELLVLELQHRGHVAELLDRSELGPTEEYIEEF